MKFRPRLSLPVVLATTFGVGLLASAYLNVYQHKNAEDDRKLMQGQITDLTYQLKQDQDKSNASPTPTPQATPEAVATPEPSAAPTPAPSTAVLGAADAAKTAKIIKVANLHLTPATTSKVVLSYLKAPVGTVVTLGVRSGAMQQVTVNGVTGYMPFANLQ